jgi:nicotinamidase-related amidase
MTPADTGLLVIDVQEKLIPFIKDADQVVRNIGFLLDGAKLLDVPVQVTEQYPKGLGKTIPELAARLPPAPDKVSFSCCAIPEVVRTLQQDGRTKVLLCGIETHVCVMQTALDLLALDFRVFAAVDAVGSRYSIDHELALRRLERAGGVLTTVETAVFEWTGGAHHPQFKAVSKLIQERMKRAGSG